VKVISVKLGILTRLGPHRVEVETEPTWWQRLFGARPQRLTYEGGIIWRNAVTGVRAEWRLERWLEEQAGRARFLAQKEEA
jgi:hypothetical protein